MCIRDRIWPRGGWIRAWHGVLFGSRSEVDEAVSNDDCGEDERCEGGLNDYAGVDCGEGEHRLDDCCKDKVGQGGVVRSG